MSHRRKMRSFGLGERLRYRFDMLMARGARGQFMLLVGVAGVMLLAITAVTWLAATLLGVGSLRPDHLVAKVFMLLLVPDPVDLQEEGTLLFFACMVSIIGGLFVGGTLIGILTTAIDGKMEELRRGRSFVAEANHTVVLGWSSKIFRIVGEIVIANENHPGQALAVLSRRDSVEMEEAILEAVPELRGSRLVCRSGNPISTNDLELVNLQDARSIIVLSPEDKADPDSHVIKILLTLAKLTRSREDEVTVVVEVKDRRNRRICEIIAEDARMRVVTIVPDVVIPRLLVQSCRKKGLSYVYLELFDFDGDEIYFRPLSEMPALVGKRFAELLVAFETSAVIGLLRGGETVMINPPDDMVCGGDDEVIAISEDDDTVIPSREPAPAFDEEALVTNEARREIRPEKNLVLGWTSHVFAVIAELDEYVHPGSTLTMVSAHPSAEETVRRRCQNVKNHELVFLEGDVGDRRFLDTLAFEDYDNILVLPDCSVGDLPAEELDALTIKCLVHLRDIARHRGIELAITSQILAKESADVASVTRLGDFVVSDEIVGRIIAQLAEDGRLKQVFDILLTPEDSEIYIKPMADYVRLHRDLDFYTVVEAARRRREIAIGFIRGEEVVVNVVKSTRLRFAEGDRIVVVAED